MAQFNNSPSQTFRPGSVAIVPSSQVELRIACRGLLDRDITSKSDPMCVVFLKDSFSDRYSEVGRTEVIKNTVNPDFVKQITMTYNFEEYQKLRFDIYDSDCHSSQLDHHDYLGRMECSLGEVVGSQGSRFKRPLIPSVRGQQGGFIFVSAEEIGSCKEVLVMQFAANNLDKKDFLGKSDPFLVFSKINEDNSSTVVHKTEVVKNTLNPTWRTFSVPMRVLCNGDLDRTIIVQCFDWDSDGGHDLIGEFQTNVRTLMKGQCADTFYYCISEKKRMKKKSYKNSGTIRLLSCRVEKEYSFLDFIQGGTQLHFTVAVDFTASNGDPRQMTSLHSLHPTQPNAYVLAIRAIGQIISDYDSDKMFPALGFGAKVPPDGRVSHEFFLNGNPSSPYCQGVDGILQAYYHSLQVVQLYGPTNFSPVINHVARFATAVRDGSAYFVLLIITDGVISDMNDTKKAIIYASGLPMSIIIVGVGGADFQAMEELDGDYAGVHSDGQCVQRDIVQFVPLRDFQNPGMPWEQSQARLAKEVLAEVPKQLVTYMKRNNIMPRAPIPLAAVPSVVGEPFANAPSFAPVPSAPM